MKARPIDENTTRSVSAMSYSPPMPVNQTPIEEVICYPYALGKAQAIPDLISFHHLLSEFISNNGAHGYGWREYSDGTYLYKMQIAFTYYDTFNRYFIAKDKQIVLFSTYDTRTGVAVLHHSRAGCWYDTVIKRAGRND